MLGAPLPELGRRLFNDTRLSANQTQSCASCHQQQLAFTDGRKVGVGSTGEHHTRNVPTLTNVGVRGINLERQIMRPLLRTHPIELGAMHHEREIMVRIAADPSYRDLFARSFPNDAHPYTLRHAARAIAAFERTLISNRSPFDRAAAGEHDAMPPAAWRGLHTFRERGCASCHAGANFSRGGKVPTLRNVTLTAPYLRDGSAASIDEVFDRHAPRLTKEERAGVAALLDALTDREFVATGGGRETAALLTAPPR